jgi:hypothetical protein
MVLNKWIGSSGTWSFHFRMNPSDLSMKSWDDDRAITQNDFAVQPEYLDVVRVQLFVPRASTWLCSILCGDEEVLRYPFQIQSAL